MDTMDTVFYSNDMLGYLSLFLKMKHMFILLTVSKKYRNIINNYLWKTYKISIKNLSKKKCLDCDVIDLCSIRYKYCESCISNCHECIQCFSIPRQTLYTFPASYEFARGFYEQPFYKYCCLECIYTCCDCGFKNSNHKEFFTITNDTFEEFTLCKKCKDKNRCIDFKSPFYWIGDTIVYGQVPFDDYRYDPYFSDEIFLFSFYLQELFE